MSMTADDRLAAQVARELSGPEPGVHFGTTLLVATVVASPLLGAAAMGRQPVPLALGLYAVVLVVVWFLAGLVGGVLAMATRERVRQAHEEELDHSSVARDPAAKTTDDRPSPTGTSKSVGSDSAH